MRTENFTLEELNEYYKLGEIIFFTSRKCYELTKDESGNFKFIRLIEGNSFPGDLPHSKRRRFYAMKKGSSYCQNYGI